MEIDKMESVKKPSEKSFWTKLKMGYNPMEEGVRWTEKYSENFEGILKRMPLFMQKFIFILVIVLLGSSLKGE